MNSNDDSITYHELKQVLFDYIDDKIKWDSFEVNGTQFDKNAFKDLISETLLLGSKLSRISQGIALIRDHPEIASDDVRSAMMVFEKGIDQVLPRSNW